MINRFIGQLLDRKDISAKEAKRLLRTTDNLYRIYPIPDEYKVIRDSDDSVERVIIESIEDLKEVAERDEEEYEQENAEALAYAEKDEDGEWQVEKVDRYLWIEVDFDDKKITIHD